MSVAPFPPPPSPSSRLDQLGAECRADYKRGVRDIAATKKRLIEARELCRQEGRSFDDLARSGFFGYGWRQVYYLIKGRRGGGDLNNVQVLQQKESEYLLTPFDRLAQISQILGPDYFDAYPFPRPEGFDCLTTEWGRRTFANPMFNELERCIQKTIEEFRKGKLILIVLPLYANGQIARLLCAGAVVYDLDIPEWRSIKDGVSTNPKPPEARPPCVWLLLDPHREPGEQSNRSPGAACHTTISSFEYWTLKAEFDAMGITWECPFEIDVASPGAEFVPWVPARKHYTLRENGLLQPWYGFIYCNPPHGIDNGVEDWIERFISHPDGIFLSADWTSTPWWKRLAKGSDAVLFCCPKMQFIKPDYMPQSQNTLGTSLFARGERGIAALRNAERADRGTLLFR